MTTHGNEILPLLCHDPFDDYHEEYDQGLFQFQSNEVELSCHRSLLEKIHHGDRIILTKHGISIKGIVTGKRPSLTSKTGMIRIQDGNILVKNEIVRHRWSGTTYTKTLPHWPGFTEHLRAINSENSIFQALDIEFGNCLVPDESIIYYLPSTYITKVQNLNPRFYEYGDRRFLRLTINDKNLVIEYNVNTDSVERYWKDKFPSWYNQVSKDSSEFDSSSWLKYYNRARIAALIPPEWTVFLSEDLVDIENSKYFRIDHCKNKNNNNQKLFIHVISSFEKIPIDKVYLYSAPQQFLNIVADMCFLTNSYFFVRDFDTLVIRPHETGYNSVDISHHHDLIISADQEGEEYAYEDYSLKSQPGQGNLDNAFGISPSYIKRINTFYRNTYKNVRKIKIEALRKGGNNPFNYIRINDEILDSGKSLGLVRNVNPSKDGKRIEFTIFLYVTTEYINNWWSL